MKGMVGEAIGTRLMGERPSPPKTIAVAATVGFAVAAATYKVLRSQ